MGVNTKSLGAVEAAKVWGTKGFNFFGISENIEKTQWESFRHSDLMVILRF